MTIQKKETPRINIIKPTSNIDTIKVKPNNCNHIWILCSHPIIPYTAMFCDKCHIEKSN